MYDASVKIPPGVITGNYQQLGNYDECLLVKSGHGFTGKACSAKVNFEIAKDNGKPREPDMGDLLVNVAIASVSESLLNLSFVILINIYGTVDKLFWNVINSMIKEQRIEKETFWKLNDNGTFFFLIMCLNPNRLNTLSVIARKNYRLILLMIIFTESFDGYRIKITYLWSKNPITIKFKWRRNQLIWTFISLEISLFSK